MSACIFRSFTVLVHLYFWKFWKQERTGLYLHESGALGIGWVHSSHQGVYICRQGLNYSLLSCVQDMFRKPMKMKYWSMRMKRHFLYIWIWRRQCEQSYIFFSYLPFVRKLPRKYCKATPCSRKAKLCQNNREINRGWYSVDRVYIYSYKTNYKVKREGLVCQPKFAVMLKSSKSLNRR